MSWAALNRELRELLPRFALPADLDAAEALVERLNGLTDHGGALTMVQASGLAPTPTEEDALSE